MMIMTEFLFNIYDYPSYRSWSPLYGFYYWPWVYDKFYTTSFYYIPTFLNKIDPYIYISRKEQIPLK